MDHLPPGFLWQVCQVQGTCFFQLVEICVLLSNESEGISFHSWGCVVKIMFLKFGDFFLKSQSQHLHTLFIQKQVVLDSFGCQVLAVLALTVEQVMASHLNPKKDWLIWSSQVFKWDSCEGIATQDINQRAKMCYEHTQSGIEISKNAKRFHYSGDKGYAGIIVLYTSI